MEELFFPEEDPKEEKNFQSVTNRKGDFNILKTDSEFEVVYKKGMFIVSPDKKLKANYLIIPENKKQKIRIGLSVSSKKGNSVWRNRIKRIIKEALRSNDYLLKDIISQINAGLWIVFSPHTIDQTNYKKVFLKDIQKSVLDILTQLKIKTVH